MNFDAMRSDGYADTQIVDMLKQNPLFQGAVNVDGLKEKGLNDTQIIDSLKEDATFKDEIQKRKDALLATPQEELNNEQDRISEATPQPNPVIEAPAAPTMLSDSDTKETTFLGSIKQAGEKLLNSITGTAKEINRDVIKPVVAGVGNVIDATVPFIKKEDLGIEKLPSDTQGAYELNDKEREASNIIEAAKVLSNSQLILPSLFGNDEKNSKEAFDKISQALMNTNIADKVEMDDKNQLYITKDGKEYKVEDSFFKTLPSMLDAYKNTIVGGTGGTIMGAALATSKVLPTPQLKAAAIAGGAVGSIAGSAIDMIQASDKTGLSLDPQHFVNKLSEEGALSIVGDKLIDIASQGVKPLIKEAKEFFTGDTRAYSQLKKDLQINDEYAEKALTNLNTVLEKPLEDTKQARMYAIALEHPQGLSLLEEALKRNQTASNVVENEIMKRTDSILKSMEENAIAPKEVMQFLEDSSDAVSKKYSAMREILRNDLSNVPVQIDTEAISKTIKELSNSAHDPQVKASFENFGNFIKSNANYTENIDGLMELRQGVNRFFNGRNVKEWVAPDNAMLKKLIGGIDEAIYKTIDEVGDPKEAMTLKTIFEDAKADFSAQKRAEASKFFKKIDADGLTSGQRATRMVKGLEADDESAQYVLSRLSTDQREKLELTAINEVVQKELYGSSGGVKAIDYEDVISKLKELSPNLKSDNAKSTVDFLEKMENFFAKDRELIGAVKPIAQVGNNIATDAIGKMHMKTAGLIFEFAQRKIPFTQNAKRLDIYYRLGKYMEQSHNTKELMLKMYNDPLSDTADKAFFGKAISYMSKGDDDALGAHLDTRRPPESPSGGSGLSEDEIKDIETQITKEKPEEKDVSVEDIKAKIAENVKAQYEPKQIELKKEDTPLALKDEDKLIDEGKKIAKEISDVNIETLKDGYINDTGVNVIVKTLSGAGLGGIPEQDYNGDGMIDAKDRAIGVALGIVAFHSLTSQPAFTQYKSFAEHSIRTLENKAMQGDVIAKGALGVNFAQSLETRYIKNNMVDAPSLLHDAIPFKKVAYTKENFASQFGAKFGDVVTVVTPKGVPDITIDTKSQYYKLNSRFYKEDRTMLAGVINDILTNPLFVVEHNNARKFFAVFNDNGKGIYAISVSEKEGQINALKSNYRPIKQNDVNKVDWKTIQKLIEVPDGNVLYVRSNDG